MKLVQAIAAAGAQIVNLGKEAVNRALGIVDFVGCLLGLRPSKKLRLRVVILRDEAGNALVGEHEADAAIAEAIRVFEQEVQTRVVPVGDRLVVTLDDPAPTAALDVRCGMGAWGEDFGEVGNYFRRSAAYNMSGTLLGYAAPVTVFVVRDVIGKGGCSLSILADHVTVDVQALRRPAPRVLAHEVAHAGGLWHSGASTNLMHPGGPGESLGRWQRAVFRNSRHVTYL